MYKLISLISTIAFLGGCIETTQHKMPVEDKTQKSNKQMLPPKYISIDGFKACLDTQTKGLAVFYCMPDAKPHAYSNESWEQLNNLDGSEKLHICD